MAGAGYKSWSAGNVLTASDLNTFVMEQAVMSFAGTAARGSALPSPSAGMVSHIGGGTVQVYNGTAWVALGGGITLLTSADVTGTTGSPTISTSGSDTIYAFTGSGTITLGKTGYAQVLVIGGGGGSTRHVGNGNGDAGLLTYGYHELSSGSNTVTVGAGGTGDSPSSPPGGSDGNNSVLGSLTARRGTFVNTTPNGFNDSLSIDGTSRTYATGAVDPAVANRGHGGKASATNSGAGSSGYVVVRVKT